MSEAVSRNPSSVGLSGASKAFLLFLVFLGAGLSAGINYWGYIGFPSPGVLADWPSAKTGCVNLAQENKSDLLPDGVGTIQPGNQWVRKGKIVVELNLRKNENEASYTSRLCVVGGGEEEIVPALSEASWQ